MKRLIFGKQHCPKIQFIRYFFVGATAAVVDLVVFTVCVRLFDIGYIISAFIGYMLGLAVNHTLCLLWVFSRKHGSAREISMVVGIALGGLLWTWILLFVFIDLFAIDSVVAKVISQIIVLAWNFGMRKWLVFE